MDEVLKPAEILPIGVLQKPGDNRFIAFVKSMFQVMQPDQQAGRLAWTPLLGIERTEPFVKDQPVDLMGELVQRMLPVENLIKT
jgi:hypothetical protein